MKSIFFIISIALITSSCKDKGNYDIHKYENGQFITLISKEKTVWVLEFSCLYNVTTANVEDLSLGSKERISILNGEKILTNSIIKNLDCMSFELPKSLDVYDEFIDSVKNNDSLRINSLSYPQKGIYIHELIKRGYVVTFSDDEGEFHVH